MMMNAPGHLMPAGNSAVADVAEAQQSSAVANREGEELTEQEFNQYIEEIHDQPDWRTLADRDADYYDNNQIDPATLDTLQQKGMLPTMYNLVQPTIDSVLGMETRTRVDWYVAADNDFSDEVAEAMDMRLHELERETEADMEISAAYAGMVKSGVAWIETGRNPDPFAYRYDVSSVHRREIYWDWAGKRRDMSDWRYLMRWKWFPKAQAIAAFPQKAKLIEAAAEGWPAEFWMRRGLEDVSYGFAFNQEARTSLHDWEWRNAITGRVVLMEVWYRRWVRGYFMRLPDGRSVEVEPQSPYHQAIINRGLAKPEIGVYSVLRKAIYCGPHKLVDVPARTRRIRYIPFFAYREDLTGSPYGLIRPMIAPQDEINARVQRMLWLLSAKRVEMDADALDETQNTIEEVLYEITRGDSVVVLNKNRMNKEHAFKVYENMQLADAQHKVMEANIQKLQLVRGVYNAMLGRDPEVQSGVAINSLLEQGQVVLAAVNANFAYGRKQVGGNLLQMLIEDHSGRQIEVEMEERGGRRRVIVLNQPAQDPQTGLPFMKNDVSKAVTKIALNDVPQTSSYRAHMLVMMSEVLKSLPPDLQAVLSPYYVELMEHPKRKQMAELLRRKIGVSDEESMSPEERQKAQADAQEALAMQKRMAQQEIEERDAQIAKTRAEVAKIAAEIQARLAEADAAGQDNPELREASEKIALLNQALADKRYETDTRAAVDLQKEAMRTGAAREGAALKAGVEREKAAQSTADDSLVDDLFGEIAEVRRELREAVKAIRGSAPPARPSKQPARGE